MKTQEETANKKMILAVMVFVIMFILLLSAWFAGQNIGVDLGRFIIILRISYNFITIVSPKKKHLDFT